MTPHSHIHKALLVKATPAQWRYLVLMVDRALVLLGLIGPVAAAMLEL